MNRIFPKVFALRITCFLAFLLASASMSQAQAPTWQMAMVANGTGASTAMATTTDVNGNIYISGQFVGTISLGTITLISAGQADAFVAKWSPVTGNFVWAQRAGGIYVEAMSALVVSGNSVYVAGHLQSPSADFGSTSVATAGGYDAFVAKLTDNGTSARFDWVQRGGGDHNDLANSLAVVGSNVYVLGSFDSSTISFGSVTLTNMETVPFPKTDIFVAKLTDNVTSGSFTWAQRVGGMRHDYGLAIAAAGSNVYIAGNFGGSAVFGSQTLSTSNSFSMFVAKLIDAGATSSVAWAQKGGGSAGVTSAAALAVRQTDIYVAGPFGGATATFGSSILTKAGGSASNYNIYVAKLNDAGTSSNFVWAQQAGGIGSDEPKALAITDNGVYVTGTFSSTTATFGSTVLTKTANSGDLSDLFVTKLTDAGASSSFAWAQQAGGEGVDGGRSIAVNGSSVYVTGYAETPIRFGNVAISAPANGITAFLASLTDNTLLHTSSKFGLNGSSLYPNPAHGSASLKLSPAATAANTTLTLTDALGQVVRHFPIPTGSGTLIPLNIADLPPGLYLLHIQAKAEYATRTLVIE